LMFYIQMICLGVIESRFVALDPRLVMPLPVQLKSYMRKVYDVNITSKSTIVKSFKEQCGYEGRISQHKVEAWFLARLGEDVCTGMFKYKLPSREAPLVSWRIINHEQSRTNTRGQKEIRKEI